MADWYEEHIEEPVRELVKLLRNNGFNTECSCGHEMYVQCNYILDGEIQRLHNLLTSSGYENYDVVVSISVRNMIPMASLDIRPRSDK
jgi:pyrrolidone-carboxylate peptidase